MAKFSKKRGKSSPAINTASLPDIIFMLLFFFMVVTVLRNSELKVNISTPSGTELTKLEQKQLVNYLYIGKPTQKYAGQYGTATRLQLNDAFSTVEQIPLFLEQHKQNVPEAMHPRITSAMRVDVDTKMGFLQDVKTQLRKSGQLRVNYSARPAGQ